MPSKERKQNSKDEDFARELVMNLSDNEKEYMIVLYAVRKTLKYAKNNKNN